MSTLRVAELISLTPDSCVLSFEVPAELQPEFHYRAGQHLNIEGADGKRRAYSLCDPPSAGLWRVGIKKLPGGGFSETVLGRLCVDDNLEVLPPAGQFFVTPDPQAARHYAFVGAGSGITPLLSMMSELLAAEPESSVTLLFGNKTPQTVMFAEELAALATTYADRFRRFDFYSQQGAEQPLFSGRLDGLRFRKAMRELVDPKTVDAWYLCGPHQMIEMLTDTLLRVGVPRDQIHSELFFVKQTKPSVLGDRDGLGGTAEITVTYQGQQTRLTIPRDGSDVLRNAIKVRPELPYSCRGGVCGTCRALVTEGTAAMHSTWALEKADVDAGYVLGCQSYPLTESLALDFDA